MDLGITRRFRSNGQRPAGQLPVAPPSGPEVGFVAFAEDCRLRGRVRLTAARLTEMLNGSDPLALFDVDVDVLADGRTEQVGDLAVEREELCAVVVDGPRGDPSRRVHTRTTRVLIDVGPYHIGAELHGTPASEPMQTILRRPAFVPVTDATLTYRLGDQEVSEEIPALLVNRLLARSFSPAEKAHIVYVAADAAATRPSAPAASDHADRRGPSESTPGGA
jgi:hypothetical protein